MDHLFRDVFKAVRYWLHRLFSRKHAMTTSQEGRGIQGIFSCGYFCTFLFCTQLVKCEHWPFLLSSVTMDEVCDGRRQIFLVQRTSFGLFVEELRGLFKWKSHTTHWISPGTLEWWHKSVCVCCSCGVWVWLEGLARVWVSSHLENDTLRCCGG